MFNLMTPDAFRSTLTRQTRQAFELNQKIVDFQMGQLETATKQLSKNIEVGHKAMVDAVRAAADYQKSMLDALTADEAQA
jgi:uncharacterized protein YukE